MGEIRWGYGVLQPARVGKGAGESRAVGLLKGRGELHEESPVVVVRACFSVKGGQQRLAAIKFADKREDPGSYWFHSYRVQGCWFHLCSRYQKNGF